MTKGFDRRLFLGLSGSGIVAGAIALAGAGGLYARLARLQFQGEAA